MKKCRLTSILAFFVFAYSPPGFASPWGTNYIIALDALVQPADIEGHAGQVSFDGIPEIIPNDIVPPDPASPGNPLLVTEDSIINSDGSETVSFWVDTVPESCPTLFCNPFNLDSPAFFNIQFLQWNEGAAAKLSDIEFLVTSFSGDSGTPINPLLVDISGSGTEADPLFMFFEFDPLDFEEATDLHLQFNVSHVPIPAAVWLFGSGLLGLIGIAKQKKA